MAPSAPQGRKSNKDAANARADAHASRAPHLKRQACSTRCLMTLGSEHALAFARSRTNVLVSNLPSQHNQPCSGLAAHELRISALFPLGQNQDGPFRRSATEKRGYQQQAARHRTRGGSAMISNRRPPLATGTAKSKSLNSTLVATLAPPSRHTRVAALSMANPRLPRTPALAHAAR